jgi:hypothetical protein
MGNLILNAVTDRINKAHTVLNFVIPIEKVTQYIPSANHEPLRRDEHAGIYIGKMLKEDEWIYNDTTLTWMLKFAMKSKQKGEKIHLYICSALYNSLVDDTSKKEILTEQEQVDKIYKLAKKAKLKKEDIVIHKITDNHKLLFSQLQANGLNALDTTDHIKVIQASSTSLDIARLLFSLSQQHPELRQKFLKLTPSDVLETHPDNHPLTYYGMIECAFRIVDALHGITTQWWLITQRKYDDMIQRLLSCQTGIPEIDMAFSLIWEELSQKLWKRYFKNDTYRKLMPKEEQKKQLKSKARNITLAIAIWVSWTIGGYSYKTYIDKKHAQKARHENLIKFLSDKSITRLWEGKSSHTTIAERKAEAIESWAREESNKFEIIYGLWDMEKRELEDLMIGVFCNQKEISFLWPKDADDVDFIRDIFVPQTRPRLLSHWFSLKPYELSGWLEKYENTLFRNMLDMPESMDKTRNLLNPHDRIVNGVSDIHFYRWIPWITANLDGKDYLWVSYFKDGNNNIEYMSFDQGKTFVERVFREKYPILRDIVRSFRMRYMNKRDKWINEVEFELEVEPLIIKTCILNNLVQDIPWETYENPQDIVDSILDNNIMPILHKQLPSGNKYFSQPYEYLISHITALKNTLNYHDTDEDLYRATDEKLALRDYKHIWYYQDSTGAKYKLVIVKYRGKDFLLASEENKYNFQPWALYGKKVAEELLQLWWKIWAIR